MNLPRAGKSQCRMPIYCLVTPLKMIMQLLIAADDQPVFLQNVVSSDIPELDLLLITKSQFIILERDYEQPLRLLKFGSSNH